MTTIITILLACVDSIAHTMALDTTVISIATHTGTITTLTIGVGASILVQLTAGAGVVAGAAVAGVAVAGVATVTATIVHGDIITGAGVVAGAAITTTGMDIVTATMTDSTEADMVDTMVTTVATIHTTILPLQIERVHHPMFMATEAVLPAIAGQEQEEIIVLELSRV
jgi:hypothetical protein